jgi:hypothetical protein
MAGWLLSKIAADEAACMFRRWRTRSLPEADWARVVGEIEGAAALHRANGWDDAPATYHRTPTAPDDARVVSGRVIGIDFEHLQFASGYTAPDDEPGAERWNSYAPCTTAHAWLRRRSEAGRRWLICIPGYGMGAPLVDLTAFDAARLGRELGVNVAVPVLPLHGPRRTGWLSGDGFFAGDCLDTLHAQAQAVWDVRRLIAWIRAEGGRAIGVYGLSLGGYTTALLAALEPRLACVVAGIPASDFIDLARHHLPAGLLADALRAGVDWSVVQDLYRVISPLAMPPRVPWGRRYLFAGTADRIVPIAQARRLWQHWGRPHSKWYRGTHLSFAWEPVLRNWLDDALRAHLSPPRQTATRQAA